ncbi:MAG: T9SS type A sorting domain-containing protein [Bacteroidota bacterium]
MYKLYFALSLLSLIFCPLRSQDILDDIAWAETFNGALLGSALLDFDSDENLILAAEYNGCEECFIAWQQDTLFSGGDSEQDNVFLARIDGDGNLLWHLLMEAEGPQSVISMEVDNDDNILLYIRTDSTFFHQDQFFGEGYNLMKLDPTGSMIWCIPVDGNQHNRNHPQHIATDCNNDIVLMGVVSQSPNFDIILDTLIVPPDTFFQYQFEMDPLRIGASEIIVDTTSIFLAKLAGESGELEWARTFEYQGDVDLSAVETSGNSDITVLGGFRFNDLTIDDETLILNTTQSPDNRNLFLLRLDENGELKWAKSYFDNATSGQLEITANGNIITSNYFLRTTIYESAMHTTNGNASDLLLFAVDSLGEFLWSNTAGTTATNIYAFMETNTDNELYLSGDMGRVNGPILNKFSPSGEFLWEVDYTLAISTNNLGRDIAMDPNGNLYQVGTYGTNIVIGTDTLTSENFGSAIFIVKFQDQGENTEHTICDDLVMTTSPAAAERSIQLYPNPAFATVNIAGLNGLSGSVQMSIYGVTGTLVSRDILPSPAEGVALDVSRLRPGMYYIEFVTDDGILKPVPLLIQR